MRGDPRDDLVASYYRVRQALGMIGLALPVLLLVTGWMADGRILPSMSDYYHTLQRDVFVGALTAIGLFLVAYKGHSPHDTERLSDNLVTNMAGAGAIAIALFPNEVAEPTVTTLTQAAFGVKVAVTGHYIAAQVFLFSLAYMCIGKFAQTASPARRRIYLGCGFTIIAMGVIATISAYFRARGSDAARAFVLDRSVVFWCEAFGVWAFGVAWLTKGRAEMLLSRRRL